MTQGRPPSLAVLPMLALLALACGGEPAPLVLQSGETVRRCTDNIEAKRPYGAGRAVDRYAMEFEVPPEVSSFLITTYTNGYTTALSELTPPSRIPIDLVLNASLRRFHPAALATAYGVGVDADRFMVPPAPAYTGFIEHGVWEVQGDTSSKRFCVAISATGPTPGTDIALAVYSVGLPGHTATTLASDPDWRQVLDHLNQVYGAVGIGFPDDGITYVDVSVADANRFSILRSFDEIFTLIATSDTDDHPSRLRINVFLIRGFAGQLDGGLLGISSGVPGAAGVHGTSDSGIVFAVEDFLGVEDLGDGTDGNTQLARLMAHEIGHYLSLFHTTEIQGGEDPLDDTPLCGGLSGKTLPELLETCEDTRNIMFPYLLRQGGDELTPQQQATLHVNPLVQAR